MADQGQFGSERAFWISGPLAGKGFLFRSMTGTEQVGRLYELEVDLLNDKEDLKLGEILGKDLTVSMELADGKKRHFHGIVTRFGLVGRSRNHAIYRASVRPRLWLLTRKADCRIFQKMTVGDIIKQVLGDHDIKNKIDLAGTHNEREYCVQYRETDFDFVSRLMEQDGIYYYFTHEENGHTLILTDQLDAGYKFAGYETVAYKPPTPNIVADEDFVHEWNLAHEVQPGQYAHTDFDFTKPKSGLATRKSKSRGVEGDDFEVYDYPGEYDDTEQGGWYAQCRLDEMQARFESIEGAGNARGIAAGARFKLKDHPRGDQNREYFVVAASHTMQTSEYTTGESAGVPVYRCEFKAMDGGQQFRSPRVTPLPVVRGPQTAMVVGPEGEEIFTDKYGRVKLLFHWDRAYSYAESKYDENTSCWVRVAQVWAGKTWGGIQIPRIGQEVIVEFLEGDPDRPIITGRVYNDESMPPYELPTNKTQSGVKSRSSKEGTGEDFNEIRFEDAKGKEQVYIHAQRNQDGVVENDQTLDVGNDRKESIGNDRTLTVGGNKSETVDKNKKIEVKETHTETVAKDMSLTVNKSRTMTISENLTEDVSGEMKLAVQKARSMTVGQDLSESVDGKMMLTVAKDRSTTVKGGMSTDVAKDMDLSVGGAKTEKITKAWEMKAKSVQVTADDSITFKTGSATIEMKKSGDITIKGKKITIKGSGDVVIKGSKVTMN